MQSAAMQIAEIFRSIQGEGLNQGRPCTFIRLAGCNLGCTWCDTPHAREAGEEIDIEEIVSRVGALSGNYLCITGGEPLLQIDQLLPLLRLLAGKGYQIDIETNGTLDFRECQPFASICMDVKCPSSGEKSDISLLSAIRVEDSVKFVVADEQDCRYAAAIIACHPIRGEIFCSPVYGSDYPLIAGFILAHDLPVRLQLQLHRLIGVR
jgi:7-carboxy-7-deazaguanine synthase